MGFTPTPAPAKEVEENNRKVDKKCEIGELPKDSFLCSKEAQALREKYLDEAKKYEDAQKK
jgi:hypothetical protein